MGFCSLAVQKVVALRGGNSRPVHFGDGVFNTVGLEIYSPARIFDEMSFELPSQCHPYETKVRLADHSLPVAAPHSPIDN
jgi:hypothetical protein